MSKGDVVLIMEIPFLILGFTGPIGAGSSTLADIIERTSPAALVKRKRMYDHIIDKMENISYKMNKSKDEKELESLNKNLKETYEERAYINTILKLIDPSFTYISMSVMILKLAIEASDKSEFELWSKNYPKYSPIIKRFKDNWAETLELYNRSEKSYEKLSSESLIKIDLMFEAMYKLRDEITSIELKDYFNGEIKELVLQSFGNNLRQTGNTYVSEKNITDHNNLTIIAEEANKYHKYYRNRIDNKRANCFIIDAFRNPAEVEFFRRYDQFFLISVFASEEIRSYRLKKDIFGENFDGHEDFDQLFKKIDERDWGDDFNVNERYKQNVARCCYMSDISINNNEEYTEFNTELFKKFLKYLALIASPGCIQPTKEETFMNLAYSLSMRSSCISRKVGAVVTDKDGYVLGMGWNEAAHGQIGCGLRLKQDYINNSKLFSMGLFKETIKEEDLDSYNDNDSICFKDVLSERKIRKKLADVEIKKADKDKVLKEIKIKRLEYCRSLHAEENALLQVATRGGMGVNGGEIYTTTFPCELCAKKIYQSGISRIYYTEPYPNSISENIFLKDGIRNIEIRPFEGVKSFSYFKLYKPKYDKKEAQKIDDL